MKILLVVYDNGSHIHWFPQGIAYIAAALKKNHEVKIYNQDIHHYPEEHLTNYLNENKFDLIGIGVIGGYYQYIKLLKLSKAINNSINRPYFVIGGHGPSADPEYFLKKTRADFVVVGEGEETIVELAEELEKKIKKFENIDGVAFWKKSKIVINKRRQVVKNIDLLPLPAYDLFPIEHYRLSQEPNSSGTDFVIPILTGRGCPFTCNFCYRMDKGFRVRNNNAIIEEIKFLKKKYNINYFSFSDELLMSSKKRVISLCEDIIKENLNIKWNCNGRLNYATKDVVEIMKKAGCVFINYGIECYDDEILKIMNKKLTVEQIKTGIENTLEVGISPGFNIIFGNINEDTNTLNKGVEFLLEHDDCSQIRTIRPVTPYPGSPLYYYAIENGMLKDCEDFYEHKHTNSDLLSVNFTKLTDEEFYKAIYQANEKLLNNYIEKTKEKNKKTLDSLYKSKNAEFRGFRKV